MILKKRHCLDVSLGIVDNVNHLVKLDPTFVVCHCIFRDTLTSQSCYGLSVWQLVVATG
jgi:hypothetical protein